MDVACEFLDESGLSPCDARSLPGPVSGVNVRHPPRLLPIKIALRDLLLVSICSSILERSRIASVQGSRGTLSWKEQAPGRGQLACSFWAFALQWVLQCPAVGDHRLSGRYIALSVEYLAWWWESRVALWPSPRTRQGLAIPRLARDIFARFAFFQCFALLLPFFLAGPVFAVLLALLSLSLSLFPPPALCSRRSASSPLPSSSSNS